MKKLVFGTGGIPVSAKGKPTPKGIEKINELGLGAMELEFVRGVWIDNEKDAEPIKKAHENNNVVLTAHGPYYINLASKKEDVRKRSIERVYKTAKMCYLSGGYSITFHAAYYQNRDKKEVYQIVKQSIKKAVERLKNENIKIWVRPETGGKKSQFGGLDELIRISQELEMVLPCVDFAHMHARNNGKFNSYDEWMSVFDRIKKELGKSAIKNMHCHFSGINYSDKGERNHLNLKESDFNYKELAKAIKDSKIRGVMISESPNLEKDALLLKKAYEKI